MTRLLAVHGVSTPPDYKYGFRWRRTLARQGLKVTMREGRWNSTGSFTGDTFFFTNPNYRMAALEDVCKVMIDFEAGGGDIIIAHSMGTVLVEAAARLCGIKIPTLFIGTPLGNRVIRPALKVVGLARGRLRGAPKPISIWNADDPVVGFPFRQRVRSVRERELSVGGNSFGVAAEEHSASLYLSSLAARKALIELGCDMVRR